MIPLLAIAAAALAAPSACNQPDIRCRSRASNNPNGSGSDAIARYTVAGPKPAMNGPCAMSQLPLAPAESTSTYYLGVESYVPSPTDPNQDSEVSSMALQPEWIGVRINDAQFNYAAGGMAPPPGFDTYPYVDGKVPAPPPDGPPSNDFPYAWGKFDTVHPAADHLCRVSVMNPSDVTYPDIPAHPESDGMGGTMMVPDQPETHVKYEWSNVRVYVTPDSIGDQTYADLTVTQDKCSISYHVSVLVPRVPCGTTDPATGTTVAEPTLCDPSPNGADNPSGSGINSSVTPVCENISHDPMNPDYECMPPINDPHALP
jgi:hypothetical protein